MATLASSTHLFNAHGPRESFLRPMGTGPELAEVWREVRPAGRKTPGVVSALQQLVCSAREVRSLPPQSTCDWRGRACAGLYKSRRGRFPRRALPYGTPRDSLA